VEGAFLSSVDENAYHVLPAIASQLFLTWYRFQFVTAVEHFGDDFPDIMTNTFKSFG
jgi:hypothetical protein